MLRKVEVSELKVLSCCIWVLCALTSVSPQDHSITLAGWHFHMSLVQPPVQSRVSCYLRLAHSRLYPVWFWKHSKMNAEKLFQLNDVRSHFFFTFISSQNLFCFNSCFSVSHQSSQKKPSSVLLTSVQNSEGCQICSKAISCPRWTNFVLLVSPLVDQALTPSMIIP